MRKPKIMELSKCYLKKSQSSNLLKLARFVVDQNYNHHTGNKKPVTYENEIHQIATEAAYFKNISDIFLAYNGFGNIVGSIRLIKWDFKAVLPIQKIFGIDPLSFFNNYSNYNIYHIGCFAISPEAEDALLFKKLMLAAIFPICNSKGGIVFAEIDSKLLRVIKLLRIDVNVIGKPIYYLGSETIPIAITKNGFSVFYESNKSLLIKINNELSISNIAMNTSPDLKFLRIRSQPYQALTNGLTASL